MLTAMRRLWEVFLLLLATAFSKANGMKPNPNAMFNGRVESCRCLSWRVAVEANNVRAWPTVPAQCLEYIETYMMQGQFEQDVGMVVGQIAEYMKDLMPAADGKDAWILDVDDTCLSNLIYYKGKRFGCDPYDPWAFKKWVQSRSCRAIPAVLELFRKLVDGGYKVFLLTGRDEETMGPPTIDNLHSRGFVGYERLILRSSTYKGQSAVRFKSEVRRQLAAEGYRIRGNVGDQWSDLVGDFAGDRTFKIPNPMYFVP
ncbi:hypothetical protein ACLOJK_012271 [Asimina triloba]